MSSSIVAAATRDTILILSTGPCTSTIKICISGNPIGRSTPKKCTFKASKEVMNNFCKAPPQELFTHQDGKQPSIRFISGELIGHEIFLRIIHGRMKQQCRKFAEIEIDEALGVAAACRFWGADEKFLKFWFAYWSTKQDLSVFSKPDLRRLVPIFEKLGLASSVVCIETLLDGTRKHELPGLLLRYQPMPVKSFRQNILAMLDIDVPEWEYASAGFSYDFRTEYGIPTKYWSDFWRLMSKPFDSSLLPDVALNFDQLVQQDFLSFCNAVDAQAIRLDMPAVDRPAMEAGWSKIAFKLFRFNVALNETLNMVEKRKAKNDLATIIAARFAPTENVEAYWQQKGMRFGLSADQIAPKKEGADEPEENEKIPPEFMGDGEESLNDEDGVIEANLRERLAGCNLDGTDFDGMNLDGSDDEDEPLLSRDEILSILKARKEYTKANAYWLR